MATIVYLLCALTSISCAVLLLKSYTRSRTKLLLWSGLAFACFSLSNVILFFDFVIVPSIDLSMTRSIVTLISAAMLLFGLIWETA